MPRPSRPARRTPLPTNTVFTSCRNSSTRKWQNYTFLHSVPPSPSLLRNIRHHFFLMSWSFTNQCCCSLIC